METEIASSDLYFAFQPRRLMALGSSVKFGISPGQPASDEVYASDTSYKPIASDTIRAILSTETESLHPMLKTFIRSVACWTAYCMASIHSLDSRYDFDCRPLPSISRRSGRCCSFK